MPGAAARSGLRRTRLDVLEYGVRGVARERPAAGEQFVEHDAEREHVAASIGRRTRDLLRAAVVRRAEKLTSDGRVGRSPVAHEPEVEQVHGAGLRHHDVVRLDVTVNEAVVVRVLQRVRDRGDELRGLAGPTLAAAEPEVGLVHSFVQRAPLEVLHGEVVAAAPLADLVDRHDAGVLQAGGRRRLAPEAGDGGRRDGEVLVQQLERDLPAQRDLFCEVDRAHAAAAELAQDPVVAEHRADLRCRRAAALVGGPAVRRREHRFEQVAQVGVVREQLLRLAVRRRLVREVHGHRGREPVQARVLLGRLALAAEGLGARASGLTFGHIAVMSVSRGGEARAFSAARCRTGQEIRRFRRSTQICGRAVRFGRTAALGRPVRLRSAGLDEPGSPRGRIRPGASRRWQGRHILERNRWTALITISSSLALPVPLDAQLEPQRPASGVAVPFGATAIHTAAADGGIEYGIWASGAAYKVSFHDGATVVPYLGRGYERNQDWRWRTVSATVGETELCTQAPRLSHTAFRAEYDLGGIVEAWGRARRGGRTDVRADRAAPQRGRTRDPWSRHWAPVGDGSRGRARRRAVP